MPACCCALPATRGLGCATDLVDVVAGDIRLRCTLAEFNKLELGEGTQFLPGTSAWAAYGPGQVLAWPYYSLGGGGMSGVSQTTTYDAVPLGEVAVRRGEHVRATDGLIGRVQGLVIDPGSHQVTHVLLQEGHLWERKEVAIPISAVAGLDGGIRLRLGKQDVQDLPPLDVDHPDWQVRRNRPPGEMPGERAAFGSVASPACRADTAPDLLRVTSS